MADQQQRLSKTQLDSLFNILQQAGYQIIGPQVRDNGIVFDKLDCADQLPQGWQETSEPGRYQLKQHAHKRYFAWNTGPQGIKPWLFKPQQSLWKAEQHPDGVRFRQTEPDAQDLAVIGLRGCDLAALQLQDKHFIEGQFGDPFYQAQRQKLFIIAVNCSRSATTCFCVSTGDGPAAKTGFDLCLDELESDFLLTVGSDKGQLIADKLELEPVSSHHRQQAAEQLKQASQQQRKMPTEEQLMGLIERLDHQQWQDIAERCLACGNCTSVCPTCFCSKQQSGSDLQGQNAQQVRIWDSCFSQQHSYIVGKVIRAEISQRYRQWLTHKLATWQTQYGRSGCVGCGRCISWCPVGIDLVEEATALLAEGDKTDMGDPQQS